MTEFQQLQAYLREMFQFDENDLDFGIYKVLRLKRREIERFIEGAGEHDLRRSVERALGEQARATEDTRRSRIARFVEEVGSKRDREAWAALEAGESDNGHRDRLVALVQQDAPDPDREALLEALHAIGEEGGASGDALALRVYNALLSFFQLYYRNGDFGYNDRSAAAFRVEYDEAYDGRDVLFHWKHRGSYYIKTGAGFNTVRVEAGEKRVEFRLEAAAPEAALPAQNTNKDQQQKHFRLNRIEPHADGWRVVFHLAAASTPKRELLARILAEVYGRDEEEVAPYLEGAEGKSFFADLPADPGKVQGGQVVGIGRLRTPAEKYFGALAARPEFRDLGSNAEARAAALENDPTARLLLSLDRALNKFYVGTDADYFVHKDLKGFLTREMERFIKNVLLGDTEGLLALGADSTALPVARAFHAVASRIIEFLDATESFQRNLFLLKKKVLRTDYLVSLGKVPEALRAEVFANEAQRSEWRETFRVEALQEDLLAGRETLVVDTRHFPDDFKYRLLAVLSGVGQPGLDEQTDGVLINSENFQALRLLEEKYRGQVKCIYIDPPYNTSGTDFLYQNSFRHSSWLSMMADRVSSGIPLLGEDAVMQVAIDDYETARLRAMLDEVLGSGSYVTTIAAEINPPGQTIRPNVPARSHDYVHLYARDVERIAVQARPLSEEEKRQFPHTDKDGRYYWDNLRRRGGNSRPSDRPNQWYPIYVNTATKQLALDPFPGAEEFWPRDPKGIDRIWRVQPSTAAREIAAGEIAVRRKGSRWEIMKKTRMSEGRKPKTMWYGARYSGTTWGTKLVNDVLGPNLFSYPKSLYLVRDCVGYWAPEGATVLDYSAGSGTTGHAVVALNREDGGRRRFILVEMGEYFERVLLERIRRVMYSLNWKDGEPVPDKVDGYLGLVKYQRLEQYEDVLDALEVDEGEPALSSGVPLRYLYRPQEQRVRQSLDLSRPFSNAVRYGREGQTANADLLETFLYLRGWPLDAVRLFDFEGRRYLAARSGPRAVVLRDFEAGADDTENLRAVLADPAFEGVDAVYVNHDADLLRWEAEGDGVELRLITADDFDEGAVWS
jgi:adenine-specific DNA-methyltransferase